MSKFGDGLLLTIVRFQNSWPLGPGIGGQPGNRGLAHHFQLGDGSAALADGGANAVVSRISAADNDHIFPLGGDGKILRFPDDLFGGRGEEIHGIVDACRVISGYIQAAGCFGAAAQHHRVEFRL